MKIQNYQNQTSFQAKFLHSESLKLIADYAVEHNKFNRLNAARKNIDKSYLQRRIRVDIYKTDDGRPAICFSRFVPKDEVLAAKSGNDYTMDKTVVYEAGEKGNLLKFALEKIIKLGNNAPHNNMFHKIVVTKK